MTETPSTTLGNYDLLAERGQQGISFANTTTGTGTGLKVDARARTAFGRAAENSPQTSPVQNPATYAGQDFFSKFLINILMMLTGALDPNGKGNNPLMGMLSKAFGFEDNGNHAKIRELNTDIKTRGREAARDSVDYSRFDKGAASAAIRYNNQYSAVPVNEDTYKKFTDHLRQREGYRNDVYRDSEGKLTVGVGHLVRPEDGLKFGDRISDAQVKDFLEKDGRKAFDAARRQAGELGVKDESFVIALGSVNYQLGTGWREKFPSTWETMKRGDLSGAAAKLEGSLWNRQTPVRVDDFQLALRKAETTKDTFAAASSGAPKPPATDNPIVVAGNTAPQSDVTVSARKPAPGIGVPVI